MIAALVLGKNESKGFPGKNIFKVLNRPLVSYPLMAAKSSKYVKKIYVSTDSDEIMKIGREHNADIIMRPAELCTPDALGEDAFAHGYRIIRDELAERGESLELLVLLFANAATVTGALIDEGIEKLRADTTLDSAVTVSCYNMWSPLRARTIDSNGHLKPFVPFETFGDPSKLNCDRDSQGDVFFADMGVSIVRPRCLENMDDGLLPQKWMGKKIAPIHSWGGCDVDYDWQIPGVKNWLLKHGIKSFDDQES